jgi:hypothetical protein
MSSIINITGEITGLTNTLKELLEKQLKITNDLIINDSKTQKQLTIPISKDKIDVFHGTHNSILYIYLFQATKKPQLNQSSNDQLNTYLQTKSSMPVLINYRDSASYNILIANKGIASISKNVKKHKLELVSRLNDRMTLYKFAGKYLFAVDSNGFLYYYPDSIDIESLDSWKNDKMQNTLPLDKYMLLNKFVLLECYLADTAYSLEDVTNTNININTNTKNLSSLGSLGSLGSEESKNISVKENALLDENQHQKNQNSNISISSISSISSSESEYSKLGYLLSWLNPLSYYSSNTNSPTSNTSNTSSGSSASNISTTCSSNTSSLLTILNPISTSKGQKQSESENTNRDISYYLDTSTPDFNIVKISRSTKTIKTLKSHKIEIPAFITDININNLDEVILEGRIESQTIIMKFNKYLVNMQLKN